MSTHSLLWQRFLFFLFFRPSAVFHFYLMTEMAHKEEGVLMSILLTLKLKSQGGEILWYQTTWG